MKKVVPVVALLVVTSIGLITVAIFTSCQAQLVLQSSFEGPMSPLHTPYEEDTAYDQEVNFNPYGRSK